MKKQGKEVKQVISARLEPRVKKILELEFGSFQKFVDNFATPVVEFFDNRKSFKIHKEKL